MAWRGVVVGAKLLCAWIDVASRRRGRSLARRHGNAYQSLRAVPEGLVEWTDAVEDGLPHEGGRRHRCGDRASQRPRADHRRIDLGAEEFLGMTEHEVERGVEGKRGELRVEPHARPEIVGIAEAR